MQQKKLLMKLFKVIIASCFFCIAGLLNAQQITSHNQNNWFHYVGKNMFSSKLSFTLEGSLRFTNGIDEKQQWFVRPSLDYQFTKSFNGSIGYSHYLTYVYGNPALNKMPIPENHYWLQGVYTLTINDLKITNRLRDENRWVGIAVKEGNNYKIDHFDYRNRLRYMLLFTYPILKIENKPKLKMFVGDEAFMNIGKNAGKTFFNQNRLIGGFGYVINKNYEIQLSYIHQNIWNYTNTILEDNPTLRVSFITNFDFYKKHETK